ncbi:MAG: thrombospondin type 3 repeat-containing protein, partial [Candidatus Thermoplasmatota archaeon]|nr:thrombospondin type 3 repeat-containing protein [Candidatus Thermoplasmatota archaeon]
MDTKVALLSGFLVMLLVGSGLLIIVDNSGESDDGQNDKPDVVVEEITEVNQRPAAYIPDVSRVWDGENSTISGYVFDESPSTCIVSIKLIDPVTNGEYLSLEYNQINEDGKWQFELPTNEIGSWVVMLIVTDETGSQSDNVFSQLTVSEPDEKDVKVTFLWDSPASLEEPEGKLQGVVIHQYLETCTLVYKPLYQSPLLDIYADVNQDTGEFSMQFNTSQVNNRGQIIATCGFFTTSINSTIVDLPLPPEPVDDSDLDGILDDVDNCPDTPEGEPVYQSGCSDSQIDDDGDGVNNNRDICPNTPAGEFVDGQGCSSSQKDSDSDGITNNLDACPNTPSGEVVNGEGCSQSQLDSDNDGVANNLDQCPGTPLGETVDSVGCADSQKEQPPTRPKILALHGGGQTANSLMGMQGTQDLMNALPTFDFVFASTPENNNVWIRDPPGGKGEPTTDPDWADLSISYLDQVVENDGPFYAILGYSQGAAMIPVYLANTDKTFDMALMYNGYLPTTHEGLIDTIEAVEPLDIPAMVFSGENDQFGDMAPALAAKFSNSLDVHSSTADHHLPYQSDPTFDTILDFILDGLQTFDKEDSWLCQNGQGEWVRDLNGEGNSYNANNRGAGQSGGGGGSGPWFQCDVSVTLTSDNMLVNSNAIPNHNWLSAFAANADEQDFDWTIPLEPVEDTAGGHNSANCPAANGAYECAPDRGAVAVAVNGVPIFGPEEGPGGDAVALEFL